MDAIQSILSRKSTRSYKTEQIGAEELKVILNAGMAAPVGSGAYDSLQLTVVQNQEIFSQINQAVTDLIFNLFGRSMNKNFGAPTMIFVSSKPAIMPGLEYANAACVLENMAITATSLCIDNIIWSGAAAAVAQNAELSRKLGIPAEFKPLLCISLGYGTESEPPKKHKIAVNEVKLL